MNVNSGQSFNFFPVPTDIHFGFGMLRTLPQRVKSVGGAKAFVVTDPGLAAAGILDEVTRILKEGAVEFDVWDCVKPDSGSILIDRATA
jgi:alcohol dehydrogenase class IV